MRLLAAAMAVASLAACLGHHAGPMPGEPRGATFVVVDGVRLRYVDAGAGPPVLLLHGFGSSIEVWAGQMPALARRHRVIAIDLKGFGWSDRPPGDYSPEAEAHLAWQVLDALGIERASIVGHSWGASVALAMALEAPGRVDRLALVSAWAYDDQLPAFYWWARMDGLGELAFATFFRRGSDERLAASFHDPDLISEEMAEMVERSLDRPGTAAAALAVLRGQGYRRIEGRYRRIAAPALVLWGREDRVSALRYGQRLARELPRARLVVYPRCGHLPMIEVAAPATRDLVAFLEPAP